MSALSPEATVKLRHLLKLAPDAGDDVIVTAVVNQLRYADAALEVGFVKTWNEARAGGRVAEADRDYWAAAFYENPDLAREFLAQDRWSTA